MMVRAFVTHMHSTQNQIHVYNTLIPTPGTAEVGGGGGGGGRGVLKSRPYNNSQNYTMAQVLGRLNTSSYCMMGISVPICYIQ